MTDLTNKVKEWLTKSGYPMEMVVAQALQAAGFSTVQSEYFEDPDLGKWRETDIVAYTEVRNATCRAIFGLVVECKSGKDKPWVLFSGEGSYPGSLSVTRRASSEAGKSILRVLAMNDDVCAMPLFKPPERTSYGLTVAMRSNGSKDYAYDGLMSVCKSASGLVTRLDSIDSDVLIPFVWPIIVTGAPLLESYLNPDGELEVIEIGKGLLIWRNPLVNRHTLVQIYSLDYFLEDVGNIYSQSNEFLNLAAVENERAPRNANAR